MFGYDCDGTNGTPAPYFDNVRLKVYPTTGPRLVATEIRLANDGFPAIGDIDLANLGANSVRFDMAANIAARTHLRNDPGDSHLDRRDAAVRRYAGPAAACTGPSLCRTRCSMRTVLCLRTRLWARLTYTASGAQVANRYNFDLPDTGMIFPGDVLHYYFAATDHVAGDTRTATLPGDISRFGNPQALLYPGAFSVSGLPSIRNAAGDQPEVLFWNDFGFRGGQDEWHNALHHAGWYRGADYDVFDTHGPSSGVGNGLGGRATISQIDGYTDMFYTAGDLGTYTLSNGDFAGDPGNDIGLLNAWLGLGGRDLFMTGDDLAQNLYTTGSAARNFLETRMGVSYIDGDIRDNIAGQVAPLVVRDAGNPVFTTAGAWIAYGGCAGINDFDTVVPVGWCGAPGGICRTRQHEYALFLRGRHAQGRGHEPGRVDEPRPDVRDESARQVPGAAVDTDGSSGERHGLLRPRPGVLGDSHGFPGCGAPSGRRREPQPVQSRRHPRVHVAGTGPRGHEGVRCPRRARAHAAGRAGGRGFRHRGVGRRR